MDETIIIPSPNWFQVSILGASEDGWLIYGGPSKSLCFLEPLSSEYIGVIDSKQRFRTHIFHRAHKEKIVSVDISPEWPVKRNVITGGHDGVVKEWSIEQQDGKWTINYLHCHEEHNVQKEEVVGVCYNSQPYAVSIGNSGHLCRWDLNTNVVKRYTHLKNFRPTCISCSPHKQLHVAVGTRQGVIFVIDISGFAGKLIYKVRAQDDVINRISWCPQYAVSINKIISKDKSTPKSSFTAGSRIDRLRNNQEPSEALEIAVEQKKQDKTVVEKDTDNSDKSEDGEEIVLVPEDDMFDVYKDHEANEFGHKKYEPEEVLVRVKQTPKEDFLAECERLKAEILKKKNEPEPSIESLVEAMDKAHVKENNDDASQAPASEKPESHENKQETHEYAHLLASIGKYGGVKIWTQTGKLLSSCNVLMYKKDQKDRTKESNWPTLHWFKPDTLLLADGKNQVLETNPLQIDSKNKLEWRVVHSLHRRGLFFLSSNAPRLQTPEILSSPVADTWVVWSVGQDRHVISYSMKERKKIEVWTSSGAILYEVKPCAYDAGKIALAAGDGSIRVWETHTTNELEDQLSSGVIISYWQNVQGKILTLAWHPTRENCVAFATAEARVGILDASGQCEKPAKNFPNFFKHSVYSICWGEGMDLYACGNGELALFHANRMEERGKEISVVIEGQKWNISSVLWTKRGLVIGSVSGGVALLDPDFGVISAIFVFLKTIYTVAWHPQQTTYSEEESKYQNYIAVCSTDKANTIAILEYDDKDNAKQFKQLEPLSGHECTVLQVAWNPHRDAQLLSSSQDTTIRIWNVLEGECIAIFGGHTIAAQCAMWCLQPKLADKVMSCGGDGCLRLWDVKDFAADKFTGRKEAPKKKKQKKAKYEKKVEQKNKNVTATKIDDTQTEDLDENAPEASTSQNVATTVQPKVRVSKVFLLPDTASQIKDRPFLSVKDYLINYIEENNKLDKEDLIKSCALQKSGLRFLKMFGSMKDVNELLDLEAKIHIEKEDWEAYLMLLFFSGKVDDMIQFASENDLLDSYLLSLSPSVSFKYWKDTTYLYLAQLERMAAKGCGEWSSQRFYGGIIYRQVFALLSTHNLKGCIELMLDAYMFKEAYILCRLRHVDSIAEDVLLKWARASSLNGELMLSMILHVIRGDLSEAAKTLVRSNQLCSLKLASLLAKVAGHHTYAEHIDAKILKEYEMQLDEKFEKLPTRAEAIISKGTQNYLNEWDSDQIENISNPDFKTLNSVEKVCTIDETKTIKSLGNGNTNGEVSLDEKTTISEPVIEK